MLYISLSLFLIFSLFISLIFHAKQLSYCTTLLIILLIKCLLRLWIPIPHICSILHSSISIHTLSTALRWINVLQNCHHLQFPATFSFVPLCKEEKEMKFTFRWDCQYDPTISYLISDGRLNNANQRWNAIESHTKAISRIHIITSRRLKILHYVIENNEWSSFLNWHFQFNFLDIHHLGQWNIFEISFFHDERKTLRIIWWQIQNWVDLRKIVLFLVSNWHFQNSSFVY